MPKEKQPPVKRSISISQKMNEDLLSLTDYLGVNPHQYLVNELAKCIQRDSMTYQMKENTQNQLSEFMALIAESAKD